jgi:transposase
MFIGVDTHKKDHVLVALDALGRRGGTHHSSNTPEGWLQAMAWARTTEAPLWWGIENSGGLGKGFAQFLLREGEAEVREVSPQRTAQYRRHGRTQDKTDEMDALAIARLLLAEGEGLPRVPRDDVSTELRVLSDHRDNLLRERTRLINQLHAQMLQIDPTYKEKSGALTSPQGLAYCQELTIPGADRLLQTRLLVAGHLAAQAVQVGTLITAVTAELEQRVQASQTPLRALKGVGTIGAARLLAELGTTPRIPSAKALAALAGVSPVAVSSGGRTGYRLNRGGNRQLNRVIHTMALVQRRCEPQARAYYEKKRAEGKTNRAALRCLKRRLVDVLYRTLHGSAAHAALAGAPEVRLPPRPPASDGAAA